MKPRIVRSIERPDAEAVRKLGEFGTATVHEAQCTEPIQQALVEKDVPPREHLVDAAYISAALLVSSREEQDILLRGPTLIAVERLAPKSHARAPRQKLRCKRASAFACSEPSGNYIPWEIYRSRNRASTPAEAS